MQQKNIVEKQRKTPIPERISDFLVGVGRLASIFALRGTAKIKVFASVCTGSCECPMACADMIQVSPQARKRKSQMRLPFFMVGVGRLELPASWSRTNNRISKLVKNSTTYTKRDYISPALLGLYLCYFYKSQSFQRKFGITFVRTLLELKLPHICIILARMGTLFC